MESKRVLLFHIVLKHIREGHITAGQCHWCCPRIWEKSASTRGTSGQFPSCQMRQIPSLVVCLSMRVGYGGQLQLWALGAAVKQQVNPNDGKSGPGWELGASLCGHPITHLLKASSWKVLESLCHHGPLPLPDSFLILLGSRVTGRGVSSEESSYYAVLPTTLSWTDIPPTCG